MIVGGKMYPGIDDQGRFCLPGPKYPAGYCVHKYVFNESGLLTKLELFAYFPLDMLDLIVEQTEKLNIAKKGNYPVYFHRKGKYKNLHDVVVLWNKSPRKVKCYTQGGSYLKLEITAARWRGKKFLEPISTLNSLGALIKTLTLDAVPICYVRHHFDFSFIPEFTLDCKNEFTRQGLHGQLRLLTKQKLRKDLRFGLKQVFFP